MSNTIINPSPGSSMSTGKKIGLISLVLICLNAIVGSGLFLLPGQVATVVGKWGLLAYVAVAFIIMALGWCYVQCASCYSRNGGVYLYAKEAFGEFIGFEIGMMRWCVGMIAWASLTSGFTIALSSVWPEVLTAPLRQVIIISVITGLGLVNLFGTAVFKKFNNVITTVKVTLLIFFVILGSSSIEIHNLDILQENFPVNTFGVAALIIFFAFSGFEVITVVADEVENPKKNIPLAIIIGIAFCSILYFIVHLICMGVLGDSLINSASPIADVAEAIYGSMGKLLVSFAMLVLTGGIVIVSSFITPRSCQVLAEDNPFFLKFLRQNRFGAPHTAIILSTIITCVIAVSGSFLELVTISVVSRFAQHLSTSLAVFSLEKKGIARPFSKPWKRAIPVIACLGILWLAIHAETYQVIYGLGALALGIPLYFLQKFLTTRATALAKNIIYTEMA